MTKALFTHIHFHRETLLFCSVSAYHLNVNKKNAPGKRISKWIISKTQREHNCVSMKNRETLLLIG